MAKGDDEFGINMPCGTCGRPSRIHERLTGSGDKHWCLDHVPADKPDAALDAEAIRHFDVWLERMEEWTKKREASGQRVPTWRVFAAAAFSEGISFGREIERRTR